MCSSLKELSTYIRSVLVTCLSSILSFLVTHQHILTIFFKYVKRILTLIFVSLDKTTFSIDTFWGVLYRRGRYVMRAQNGLENDRLLHHSRIMTFLQRQWHTAVIFTCYNEITFMLCDSERVDLFNANQRLTAEALSASRHLLPSYGRIIWVLILFHRPLERLSLSFNWR